MKYWKLPGKSSVSHRDTRVEIEDRRLLIQIHAAVLCSSEKPCHSVLMGERAFAERTQTCCPMLSINELLGQTDRSTVAENERAACLSPQKAGARIWPFGANGSIPPAAAGPSVFDVSRRDMFIKI